MEFLSEYGLFLLEFITIVGVLVIGIVVVLSAARKGHESDGLVVEHINRSMERRADAVREKTIGRRDTKKLAKERQKARKKEKAGDGRPRVFVLDFKGDIRASATVSLREEVSAVLAVADQRDEVVLRLENAGGMVHEHGLAASQLLRLRERRIPLTIVVDKVAASGGYLMAAVADKIIAAPFAIVGSIGVLVQLPNFHRLLAEKGVDFEQLTAGKYKRTLTLFGRNTEEGREKMKQEISEIHELFKQQILEQRSGLDLERVATGEHWYGRQALSLELIDEIGTSDDYLIKAAESADLYSLQYRRRKGLVERLLHGAESMLYR